LREIKSSHKEPREHGEKIELYSSYLRLCVFAGNLTAKNPKEAQRAAKFFGVSGGKIEVFYLPSLRLCFLPRLS
jgi:hypothetical protein